MTPLPQAPPSPTPLQLPPAWGVTGRRAPSTADFCLGARHEQSPMGRPLGRARLEGGDLPPALGATRVFTNTAVLAAYHRYCARSGEDSKVFVDRRLTAHPDGVLRAFGALPTGEERAAAAVAFFEAYFETDPDAAAAPHVPVDYCEAPPRFTQRLACEAPVVEFAHALKRIWPDLCRKELERAGDDQARSSLIRLPRPFFVAGGRFRECYYWDSYWIVKGLLACDMLESACTVVDNLVHLVELLGFVPNGNRVYYLNRSQPPFLTMMADAVFQAIAEERGQDVALKWLARVLPALDREYKNFVDRHRPTRSFIDELASLAVYRTRAHTPRPESWAEDVKTGLDYESMCGMVGSARGEPDVRDYPENPALYSDLAAAAESGWDFSSRWLADPCAGLISVQTSSIVPVCLNAVLLRTEHTLARLHGLSGNDGPEARYGRCATARLNAMNALLWNEDAGMWCDYNMVTKRNSGQVAASGIMPLYAACMPPSRDGGVSGASKFVAKLKKTKLFQPGGLATTEVNTGEQWDFPNSWPPLVEMAVTGLENLGQQHPESDAVALAHSLAKSALNSMYVAYRREGAMHEKYDATSTSGSRGGGGEYEPQVGFGWTNGVALSLLQKGYTFDV